MSRESAQSRSATMVAKVLKDAVDADPSRDKESVIRDTVMSLQVASGGDLEGVLPFLVAQIIGLARHSQEMSHKMEELVQAIKRTVGFAFYLAPDNSDGGPLWAVAPVGGSESLRLVSPLNAEMPEPSPLALVRVSGNVCVGGGPAIPSQFVPSVEQDVARVVLNDTPVGEIILKQQDGFQSPVISAPRAMVEELRKRLAGGESPKVRVCGRVAIGIAPAPRDDESKRDVWVDILDLNGPRLHDLVFPKMLMNKFDRDVRYMIQRRCGNILLTGPTGTGKTQSVVRAAREAAIQSGQRAVVIHVASHTVGSEYHSVSEGNVYRALRQAEEYAAKGGYVTVVLLDEVDALLGEGGSGQRFESSVDRRVRMTTQSLLSEPLRGVFVYATINARDDSPLPAAIKSRFRNREFGRTTRGQMAAVATTLAAQRMDALKRLGLGPEALGRQMTDFLYSPTFVVARATLHSGRELDVKAADLFDCCPRKIRDVLNEFLNDVEDGECNSVDALLETLATEFRQGNTLSPGTLFTHTFLKADPNDSVKAVHAVGRG